MVALLKRVADSAWFQWGITGVIIAAGVVVGFETYPSVVDKHGHVLHILNQVILWIFVAEIVVKMGAEWPKPWMYFTDPWNVFDFLIVAACFMPVNAQYVTVLRLARLLRVLKLVKALPRLQVLVGALLKSIPSIGYVSILLGLLFYLYAVAAVFLFRENDPIHFDNLQLSMLSLFRVVTLEDWTDVMYIAMYGCANYGYGGNENLCTASTASPLLGSMFFVSFVLMGTMIVLNLFIGVIMTGMDEAKAEQKTLAREAELEQENGGEQPALDDELGELHERLAALQEQIASMRERVPKGAYREIPDILSR